MKNTVDVGHHLRFFRTQAFREDVDVSEYFVRIIVGPVLVGIKDCKLRHVSPSLRLEQIDGF